MRVYSRSTRQTIHLNLFRILDCPNMGRFISKFEKELDFNIEYVEETMNQ